MKLVIAGSRTVSPPIVEIDVHVRTCFAADPGRDFDPKLYITEVICGCAKGADVAGEAWAKHHNIPIHHEPITDEDMKLGVYMGPRMRNRRMAIRADGAIIFWDGISGGSSDMAARMLARKKPVFVIPTRKRPPKNPRKPRPEPS